MNLVDVIQGRRAAGRVSCALLPHANVASARDLADLAVQAVGLRPLGEHWLEVSESDAEAIAIRLLQRDLASQVEIMPLAEATALATGLLLLVPPPFACFTNGDWADAFRDESDTGEGFSFDPISDATLDAGIVCVGDGCTAIFWVEDEE
jgi:hypothetical protein